MQLHLPVFEILPPASEGLEDGAVWVGRGGCGSAVRLSQCAAMCQPLAAR